MPSMFASGVIPILNVSSVTDSIRWFERLGWKMNWSTGEPPNFASLSAGHATIFVCHNAQGSRGKGSNTMTFGETGDQRADKGVWIWVAVDNVDEVYRFCIANGFEITWPPTDMPWGERETHIRHPDGHVLRVGQHVRQQSAGQSSA